MYITNNRQISPKVPLWTPNTFGDPGRDSGDFDSKIGWNLQNIMLSSGTNRYCRNSNFGNRKYATLHILVVVVHNNNRDSLLSLLSGMPKNLLFRRNKTYVP